MLDHHGFWSVLPALLTITLAMITRRVIAALLVGVFAGALILSGGNPIPATYQMISGDLASALLATDHLQVFAFTLLMGAMVGVIQQNGGMSGLVTALQPLATTRRRGQLITWLMGLVIFFDDYANTLLLGTTFRPVTDRLKISREKLAYIVDSTAAPIAGIAIVSTWVAGEVDFINTGLKGIGLEGGEGHGFAIFVETIVYRFYPLLALLLVGMIAWTGREFGPMRAAEQRAIDEGDVGAMEGTLTTGDTDQSEQAAGGGAYLAVIPIAVVVVLLIVLLYVTGWSNTAGAASVWETISNGDSYSSLVYASAEGFFTAVLLTVLARRLSFLRILRGAVAGARLMLPALVVLLLAWTLADISSSPSESAGDRLGTAAFMTSLIGDEISPQWLPTIVFLLAAVVSYCTGTSWGTMTILTPLVVQTTWGLIGASDPSGLDDPIFRASIGSVLAGSIFGDHCSPISDTTILSSRASGCDLMAHVWTQMPYVLLAAAVSVVFGTIPVGFGVSVWVVLPISVVVLFLAVLVIGRRTDSGTAE